VELLRPDALALQQEVVFGLFFCASEVEGHGAGFGGKLAQ
jgi:hypothetical protein